MRFGLDDGESKTLEEVANYFGLTRERIRQIESKALETLRNLRKINMLRHYMDGNP